MFNSTNACYSLADIAAASKGGNDDYGFGGNNGWWIILLFLFCFNGNNGFFGNGFGGGAAEGYVLTSDFANIERKIDGVNNGLCDGFYTQAQLVNGINSNINTASQNIIGAINNDTIANMQNTNAIGAQITNLSNQMQSCCCDQKYQSATQFADLNYKLAEQSCQTRQTIADGTTAITLNQDANTRSILNALQDMQTQNLQDKIAQLTADNQSLKFAASQQAQNAYLIHALAPSPIPAYTVPNPYTTGNYCNCTC